MALFPFTWKKWNNNNLGTKSSSNSLLSLWKSSRVETSTRTKVGCVQKLKIVNGFGYHSYIPFHDLIYRYYYCEWYEFLIPGNTSLTSWILGIIWISRTNKSNSWSRSNPSRNLRKQQSILLYCLPMHYFIKLCNIKQDPWGGNVPAQMVLSFQ